MFKEERTGKVLEYVRQKGFCTVEQLVNWFNYSPATIRRDLTYLAGLGLVKKSYGGVSSTLARPMQVREHINVHGKVKLCEYAAEMVHDGDVIFADGTTTTYFLGEKLLGKKGITVVTSNLKLAMFCGEHKINCIVTGGRVCDSTMLVGNYCTEIVEKIKYDIAFISPWYMDKKGNFEMWEGNWPHTMAALKNADKKVVLCDVNKITDACKYAYGNVGIFDTVVFDEDFQSVIKENFPDVEIVVAK